MCTTFGRWGGLVRVTLDDLTVSFSHLDRDSLLSAWAWLLGPRRLPILVTAAGDAFVQDADDGSVHFLDAEGGCVVAVAASEGELRHLQVQG
jgi:hypothetical protein